MMMGGVAQWVRCQPVNQNVTGLIPGQGTCLGCGPGPLLGACERQKIDVSLLLALKINKIYIVLKRS